jgi:ankyrin repeat protein
VAASLGSTELAAELLKLGAKVDHRTADGMTALTRACW